LTHLNKHQPFLKLNMSSAGEIAICVLLGLLILSVSATMFWTDMRASDRHDQAESDRHHQHKGSVLEMGKLRKLITGQPVFIKDPIHHAKTADLLCNEYDADGRDQQEIIDGDAENADADDGENKLMFAFASLSLADMQQFHRDVYQNNLFNTSASDRLAFLVDDWKNLGAFTGYESGLIIKNCLSAYITREVEQDAASNILEDIVSGIGDLNAGVDSLKVEDNTYAATSKSDVDALANEEEKMEYFFGPKGAGYTDFLATPEVEAHVIKMLTGSLEQLVAIFNSGFTHIARENIISSPGDIVHKTRILISDVILLALQMKGDDLLVMDGASTAPINLMNSIIA
jgi:hypothetical protein